MITLSLESASPAPVLIIGAGPVGLTLALDLAWRGIRSLIVEQRSADEPATPRANHVSARAMETFRRLGIADAVRAGGLPSDYPPDVAWVTQLIGHELTRIRLAHGDEGSEGARGAADSGWPSPERQHKINQMFLEPVLRRAVAADPLITLRMSARLETLVQDGEGVRAEIVDLDTGHTESVASTYAIGCDGGASTVRKLIGARFTGDAELTRVVSAHVRSPGLVDRLAVPRAHRYFVVSAEQAGVAVTLDGRELWSFHLMLPSLDSDPGDLDIHRAIVAMTGIPDLEYEVFATDSWTGRRLVADRLVEGRIALCGDAAHIWVPNAGYGMNAGIADAENLAWRLSAMVEGWGAETLLAGYERERLPITEQVSRFAKQLALANRAPQLRTPSPLLGASGAAGDAERARVGAELYALNLAQFTPLGLNFAYFYDDSPDIVPDDGTAPAYGIGDYTPSTVPGCRAPHIDLPGGSLYDRLGAGFTVIRVDPAVEVAGLHSAAQQRGVPLTIVDLDPDEAGGLYEHALTLVRPDRHVAWRGGGVPHDADALLDRITGVSA